MLFRSWMAAFNIGQFCCVLVLSALTRQTGGKLIPSLATLSYVAFAVAVGALLWQILSRAPVIRPATTHDA